MVSIKINNGVSVQTVIAKGTTPISASGGKGYSLAFLQVLQAMHAQQTALTQAQILQYAQQINASVKLSNFTTAVISGAVKNGTVAQKAITQNGATAIYFYCVSAPSVARPKKAKVATPAKA